MVRRSRVQFRGPPAKKKKRIYRARADHFTKPVSLISQQLASKSSQIEIVLGSDFTTTIQESMPTIIENGNNSEQTDVETFIFPKLPIPPNKIWGKQCEDQVDAAEVQTAAVSVLPALPDDWFESPPASWVKLAPIIDGRRVPLLSQAELKESEDLDEFPSLDWGEASRTATAEPAQSESPYDWEHVGKQGAPEIASAPSSATSSEPSSEPVTEPSPPTRSPLQILIQLFAGRKKRPNLAKQEPRAAINPFPTRSDTSSDQSEPTTVPESDFSKEPSPAHHTFLQPPLLTHAQVIPDVVRPNPCRLRRKYVYVPPAPFYIDTGKVFSTEDLYAADIVQRGFHTRGSADHVVTRHKRNHSAEQLLDREGDVWAKWYKKRDAQSSSQLRHIPASMMW